MRARQEEKVQPAFATNHKRELQSNRVENIHYHSKVKRPNTDHLAEKTPASVAQTAPAPVSIA